MMLRGGGIPKVGFVDELVSTIDRYKMQGKILGYPIDMEYLDGNLPKVLGGQEREYTISNSIFPGQTYKLAIRTKDYEFRLESMRETYEDGTIDLTEFCYQILERGSKQEIFAEDIKAYFFKIAKEHTRSFLHV